LRPSLVPVVIDTVLAAGPANPATMQIFVR
jgi:hypothetical protein